MNYIAHVVPVTPMLHAVKYRVHAETGKYVSRPYEPEGYQYSGRAERGKMSEEGVHVVKIAKDEVVDIVFQNTKRFYHTWYVFFIFSFCLDSVVAIESFNHEQASTAKAFVSCLYYTDSYAFFRPSI